MTYCSLNVFLSSISLLILAAGCDSHEPPELPPIDYYLVITDSIGVESGDSCYMFHLPVDVAHSPEGNIAVLDKLKHSTFVFTSEGEFIRMVGREGEGPGEFHMPGSIEFSSDGHLLIKDGNKIAVFDSSYQYQTQMIWPVTAPHPIRAMDSSSFIGVSGTWIPSDHGIGIVSTLCLLEGVGEPTVEYFSIESVLTPENAGDRTAFRESSILSCATHTGRVFYSRSSIDRFEIHGCEPDGTPFFHVVDEDYHRVRKTDDELQVELEKFTSYANLVTGGQIGPVELELDPFRRSIKSIFTDSDERLWVRLGYYPGIVFRVYDMSGEVLFHAKLDYAGDPLDLLEWQVSGDEHGFLAYDRFPVDYPRVYMLSLVEAAQTGQDSP